MPYVEESVREGGGGALIKLSRDYVPYILNR